MVSGNRLELLILAISAYSHDGWITTWVPWGPSAQEQTL